MHDVLSESTAQAPAEEKMITATAFPSNTSAYVSFSTTAQGDVLFTCQLDGGQAEDCEFHTRLEVCNT